MTTYRFEFNRKGEINPVYDEFLFNETPIQIFFGGSSSGKSYFLAQRLVWDLIQGGRNYLVLRNVGVSIRDSVFKEVKKCIIKWGLIKHFKINETDFKITCKLNGYQAMFKGLDDVQKIKSITADVGNVTDLWYEEATECKREDYIELGRRTRGDDGKGKIKREIFSFNPMFKTSWIYKEFFKGCFDDDDKLYKDDKKLILKTTYKDNNYLTQQDVNRLEALKENEEDRYSYEVYVLGNWGVLGELVFTNWIKEDLSDILGQFDNYKNGLDFGFSNDPTAGIRSAKRDNIIYITHAFGGLGMVNTVIAENIRETLPLTAKGMSSEEKIIGDCASSKDIEDLRLNYGINIYPSIKGAGSVNYGINWLKQYKIIIHYELQDVINEFQLYQWTKNKDGDVLNIPIDKFNHWIDALRYAWSEQILEIENEHINPADYGIFV